MKLCRQCKTECSNEAKFCQECGYRFTEDDKPVKVCKNCNTHNSETSKFCSECGTPFESAPVSDKSVTVDDKSTLTKGKGIGSNAPKMTVDAVIENDYVVSSSDEEKGSQTDTKLIAQPITNTDSVKQDVVTLVEKVEVKNTETVGEGKIENLIDPDPDLRNPEPSSPTLDNQGEMSNSGEPILKEVSVPNEESFQSGEATTETIVEEQINEVEPLQTEVQNNNHQNSETNGFNVAEIIANDSYYDDVPMADNGVTRTPMDKEKKKELALIIGGALLLISLITLFLVATS